MSDDFRSLIEEIEAEAKAEGTDAELYEMRREFEIVSQAMSPGPREDMNRRD